MFTQEEIELLKQYLNFAGIARKHKINPRSNYIYKLLKKELMNKNSKGYKIQKELKLELKKIKYINRHLIN